MKQLFLPFALSVVLLGLGAGSSWAGYDPYVFDNLSKSRDALLGQRTELERARNDCAAQVDRLQQKLARYDQYLKQVDDSLRDVNDALDRIR